MNKKEAISKAIYIACPELDNILLKYSKSTRKVLLPCTFIELLSKNTYTLKEYGISAGTMSKMIKEMFPDRETNSSGGSTKVCRYVLSICNYRQCNICLEVLDNSSFNDNKYKLGGKSYECKKCLGKLIAETQPARQAVYAATKLERTPLWADLIKIKEFYNNCPKGHHVDHIVPLQGILVSGLHTIENLQYLTAHDNVVKHNSYTID